MVIELQVSTTECETQIRHLVIIMNYLLSVRETRNDSKAVKEKINIPGQIVVHLSTQKIATKKSLN